MESLYVVVDDRRTSDFLHVERGSDALSGGPSITA